MRPGCAQMGQRPRGREDGRKPASGQQALFGGQSRGPYLARAPIIGVRTHPVQPSCFCFVLFC